MALIDKKSGKIHKANVQDIKVTYPGGELIKCLPNETAFGCPTKYRAHLKLMENLYWSLNPKILQDLKVDIAQSPNTASSQIYEGVNLKKLN